MQNFDINQLTGIIVIVAPHMDDEVLACGGLIAILPNKSRIHLIYATDGMKSPAPILAGRDEFSPDLGKVRIQESTDAMNLLGVPRQNLHFLCLSDGQLQRNSLALQGLIREKIKSIGPRFVFVPFRYDRHPDHLAVNHVVSSDIQQGTIRAQLVEYFVYHRWRLMPKRDIRRYIRPEFLFKLNIADVAQQKRKALDCFTSQTTIHYSWQTRPILTSVLLDEECENPEYFLISTSSLSGPAIFSNSVLLIHLALRIEPFLQRWKYLASAYMKRIVQNCVRQSDRIRPADPGGDVR
jgi:LmbE family N-acetylglucosaminyl deacetylase